MSKPTLAESLRNQAQFHRMRAKSCTSRHDMNPPPPLSTWLELAEEHEVEAGICDMLAKVADANANPSE